MCVVISNQENGLCQGIYEWSRKSSLSALMLVHYKSPEPKTPKVIFVGAIGNICSPF